MSDVLASADCLFTAEEVDAAVDIMASEITAEMADEMPLVLCTMIGGIIATGKLLERLSFPLTIDYIHASRYRGAMVGAELYWIARPTESLKDRVVLIVDDIFDEGLTLEALIKDCMAAGAKKVYSAILVEKDCQKESTLKVNFKGLVVPNRYVFGCGMDYKGYLRNVMGIYAIPETE
ncbi:MAG: hypoxanthine-guanine phosphoribosyltransferase [Sulfuriflexus sp.]|nr:hypoxanthine-guanine phosphoribosyltransferase [Sulfuriflexus sp.]